MTACYSLLSRMSKVLALVVLCSPALAPAAPARTTRSAAAAPISITAFNIKWYGLGGALGGTREEYRQESIRDHLTKNNLWTDVIAFEEVVDVASLQDEVVGPDYTCNSYENNNSQHQHVVICAKNKFNMSLASDDDNFALETVQLGQESRYRPAVHGVLKNARGKILLHVYAVHLKAMPTFGETRLEQVRAITDYMRERPENEPAVIVGDFNTFADDTERMDEAFAEVGMAQVELDSEYTYRVPNQGGTFDRIWVTESLLPSEPARVTGPCNEPRANKAIIAEYNKNVSDHCPVTAVLGQ